MINNNNCLTIKLISQIKIEYNILKLYLRDTKWMGRREDRKLKISIFVTIKAENRKTLALKNSYLMIRYYKEI